MLKKIIKTHTARLDFVDIIKPTFLRNAVATNRQRRVIASPVNMHVGCFIFGGGGGGKQACRWGGWSLQKGPFIATKWCDFG